MENDLQPLTDRFHIKTRNALNEPTAYPSTICNSSAGEKKSCQDISRKVLENAKLFNKGSFEIYWDINKEFDIKSHIAR